MIIRNFKKTLALKYYGVWESDLVHDSMHFIQYADNIDEGDVMKLVQLLSYFSESEFTDLYVKELIRQAFSAVFINKTPLNFLEIYEEEDVRLDFTLETGADWSGYFLVAKLEETGEYLSNLFTPGETQVTEPVQGVWVRDIQSAQTTKKLWKVLVQLEEGDAEANGEAVRVVGEMFMGIKQKPIDN